MSGKKNNKIIYDVSIAQTAFDIYILLFNKLRGNLISEKEVVKICVDNGYSEENVSYALEKLVDLKLLKHCADIEAYTTNENKNIKAFRF